MARAQGARSQFATVFEVTYGTAPASGFKKLPFARSGLGQMQPLLADELLGFGRDPLAPTRDAISVDGDVVIPIDAEAFGFWLKAAFGAPGTTGSDPYTHVFESGGWSLPSFSAELGLPEVPHFAMASGVMVDQLSCTMQRSGLLTATARCIGQGEAVAASTQAGTLTEYDLIRFGHFNGSISRDSTVLANVVSAELTYANNLDRIEVIRSDGKIARADPSMAALTGQLVVRFDSQTLLTQAVDGTPIDFEFAYTLGTGESLTFDVPQVYLPRPKIAVDGPAGVQATFDFQAAQDTGGDPMITATLVNSVASY